MKDLQYLLVIKYTLFFVVFLVVVVGGFSTPVHAGGFILPYQAMNSFGRSKTPNPFAGKVRAPFMENDFNFSFLGIQELPMDFANCRLWDLQFDPKKNPSSGFYIFKGNLSF